MTYSPEQVESFIEDICNRVACGGNIDVICLDDDLPCKDTVYRWLRDNEKFSDEYARALKVRATARADRMDETTRKCLNGEIAPDIARVVNENEKWQAGKENSKLYGNGLDGATKAAVIVFKDKDDDDL